MHAAKLGDLEVFGRETNALDGPFIVAPEKIVTELLRGIEPLALDGKQRPERRVQFVFATLNGLHFNDINFLKHHRDFFPIAVAYWKLVFEWIRNPDYRRMFANLLIAAPMMGPDLSRVHVRATWPVTGLPKANPPEIQ